MMEKKNITNEKLMDFAKDAAKKAYAPYSGFAVGAALLTLSWKIYTGCNVENASYGASVCAERIAVFKAVSEGERIFRKIAIYTSGGSGSPCGICRQVLSEFSSDMTLLYHDSQGIIKEVPLSKMIPDAFNM